MKQLILFPLLSIGALQANSQLAPVETSNPVASYSSFADDNNEGSNTGSQNEQGSSRMAAAVFKAQEYCRAELKDFEFEVGFKVVSATVYFSGANFRNPEKAMITSNSLKPIRSLMDRCTPGSIVIFDEVKVIGPDNKTRTIPGISLILY